MIQPQSIPLFTGNLGQLEQHTDALRVEADGIRRAGAEAHRQFQGLSAFYQAPEAEALFTSTAPARDGADTFADKVATVADALSTYAAEVAPIIKRLEHLKSKATAFVAGLKTPSGEFDENWDKDADKIEEHRALMHDVNVAQEAFTTAEIACNNKITALVGGTQYVMNTGAKQFMPLGAELYGYSADVLDQAKELPWGTPVTQSHDWWDPDDLGYYAKSFFWDGFIVDNVWGTIDGLATLVGVHGSDEAGQAWEGVVRAIVGAETYLMESGGKEPTGVFASDFAQDSKAYAKEFGKSFVAWDMWKENPARAAATVVFNGLTLGAGPLKIASAGKAGTAAKVATTVAKVGDVIDPVGAAVKATGHAIPAIAQVTENLRGVNNVPEVRTPHTVLEFSGDAGRSVLVVEDGRFIVLKDGEVVTDAPVRERPVTAEATPEQAPPVRERELAGVSATSSVPESAARQGDNIPPQASHEAPSGRSDGDTPHGAREVAGSGGAARSVDSGPSSSGGGTVVGNGQVGTGSGGLDGHGRTGGTAAGDGTDAAPGANGEAAGQSTEAQRPNFMRDGQNPYGPPGSLTPEQIKEIQVYRANHEPGYFERYYMEDGRRLKSKVRDESGFPPIQLHVDRVTGVKTAASDAPPPIPEKYVAGAEAVRGRHEALNAETLRALDEAAAHRRSSIDYSESANRHRGVLDGSADEFAVQDVGNEYSAAMNERTKAAEAYGEDVAEHQVIPELYPNSTMEPLYGPANGNYRFDQVWRREDGGFVVVEAKSTTGTTLGKRDLLAPDGEGATPRVDGGRSAMQGSREYFMDTLQRMRMRGRKFPSEPRLANELMAALEQGKVDYILVKGKVDGARYAGYETYKFDIG